MKNTLMKAAVAEGLVLAILMALMAFSPSCEYSPPGTDMTFETVIEPSSIGGPNYEGESAQVRVISSNQNLPAGALDWVNPERRNKILEVDYSKYFVVMAFNGYRGGIWSVFKIQRIRQHAGTVFVLAHFNDFIPEGYSSSVYNSQYQVVKVSRTQITHPGPITFKLMDEKGKERATVTAEVYP